MRSVLFVLMAAVSLSTALADDRPRATSPAAEAVDAAYATARHSFEQADFARLERQVAAYRTDRQRMPDGRFSLDPFYTSFRSYSIYGADEDPRVAVSERWMKEKPESAAAIIVHAIELQNLGHSIRQKVYVDERAGVTDGAEANLTRAGAMFREARDLLVEKRALASTDPYYFAALTNLTITMEADDAEVLAVVEDGLRSTPNFDPFVGNALGMMAVRWGGDRVKVEALARRMLEARPPAQRPELYVRLYWWAGQYTGLDGMFERFDIDWPLFDQGMKNILVDYPDPHNGSWFARFACLAGKPERTASLWAFAESLPGSGAWPDAATFYACRTYAAAAKSTAPMTLPTGQKM